VAALLCPQPLPRIVRDYAPLSGRNPARWYGVSDNSKKRLAAEDRVDFGPVFDAELDTLFNSRVITARNGLARLITAVSGGYVVVSGGGAPAAAAAQRPGAACCDARPCRAWTCWGWCYGRCSCPPGGRRRLAPAEIYSPVLRFLRHGPDIL